MITKLKDRGLLKLNGADVQSFLQGQFSNDIDALEEGKVQLNAYCQHQGRIIALIWVMKKDDGFYLSFPSDLLSIIVQKLTMFKMMSDVVIEDISDQIIQLGLVDEVLEGAFSLNNRQSVALVDSIKGIEISHYENWSQICIEKQVPEVYLKTSEQFVPQVLNLDIDEKGVSFTKGCYPGQEVVARLHYLGKAKRRMYQFECEGDIGIGDGLIVSNSKSAKASGVVIRSVKSLGKSLCLATIEVEYKDSKIRLDNINGEIVSRIEK